MKPAVVIPTFITSARRRNETKGIVGNYDHTTNINDEGELDRCLASLECVENLGLVILLVAADRSLEAEALAKVRKTAAAHRQLSTLVIGSTELALVRQRMSNWVSRTSISRSGCVAMGPFAIWGW